MSKVTGSTSFCLWALLSTVAEQWQRGRPVSDYAQAGAGTRRRGAWSVVCACDECSGLTCHVGTYVLGSPRAAAQQSQTQTHAWPMGHAIHHHRRTLQARTHDCPFLFFSLSLKNKQIARLSFELLPAQRKRELNNAIIMFRVRLSPTISDVWIRTTKYTVIAKLITWIGTKRQDEPIKPTQSMIHSCDMMLQ